MKCKALTFKPIKSDRFMFFLTPQLLIRPDLLHHPPYSKTYCSKMVAFM